MNARIRTFALLATLAASGCGGSGNPVAVHAVRGTVARGGKPIPRALVRFHPATPAIANPDDPAAATRVAEADDRGQFALSTYAADDGAPAGDYVVTIDPPRGPEPEERDGPARPVRVEPALVKYGKVATSPLKATVNAGDNPPLAFDLR